jgi:hypothetical protein
MLGGVFAILIPKEDYFSKALYTFDIGQNDLTAGFFGNATIQQVNATIPDIVNSFIENIKVVEHPPFINYLKTNNQVMPYFNQVFFRLKKKLVHAIL